MSKESYARGFVKAAAAAGVDPVELAKFAADFEKVAQIGLPGIYDPWGPKQPAPTSANKDTKSPDAEIGSLRQNDVNATHVPSRRGGYWDVILETTRVPGSYRSVLGDNTENQDANDILDQAFIQLGRKRMSDTPTERLKAESIKRPITLEELDAMRQAQASSAASRYFPTGTAPWRKMVMNLIESGRINYRQYLRGGEISPETKYPALKEMKTPNDFIDFQRSMTRSPTKDYSSQRTSRA